MGLYISKIRSIFSFRKSPDVYKKELEEINVEIFEMEQNKAALEFQYYLITEFIVSYSRLLYLMVSLVFFFSTLPSTLVEYIFFCGPVLIFYILISGLKKSLKWYYDNEIKRNVEKLSSLYFRKNNILSEVQEKVALKDAKDIIKEFSPIKVRNQVSKRQREAEFLMQRMPTFGKVMKYVLKGTDNALICKHCNYHNGMALKEDFNYLSFRCCRCLKFNPAMPTEK